MKKDLVKYPRSLGKAETISKWDKFLEHPDNSFTQEDINKLTQEHYNLSGAFPYIIDFINLVCTHKPENILRKNNPKETHYSILISKKSFKNLLLGKEYRNQSAFVEKEIRRLFLGKDDIGKSIKKALPFDDKHVIRTDPIRISIINKKWNRKYSNLISDPKEENIAGGYIIEFYKPLWSSIIQREKSNNWFPLPKMFHANMVDFIKKTHNNPIFTKYGNFGNATTYRKLYLYLNLHDNSKSDKIEYDAIDLTKATIPGNVQNQNGILSLRSWYTSHQFLQKGLRLFHEMGKLGLMDQVKLIPTSVQYSKPLKQLICKLQRENFEKLPEYTSQVLDAKTNQKIEE